MNSQRIYSYQSIPNKPHKTLLNLTSKIMDLCVSQNGFVEVYDPEENQFYFQCFYNLKKVIKGNGYFVIHLKSGRVEVYDYHLRLVSYKVFDKLKSVTADQFITITHKNGKLEKFNKKLQTVTA